MVPSFCLIFTLLNCEICRAHLLSIGFHLSTLVLLVCIETWYECEVECIMAKDKGKKKYVCSNCGSTSPKWIGQCYDCGTWGSMEEEVVLSTPVAKANHNQYLDGSILFEKFDGIISEVQRTQTQINEIDRVLGGGFVPGSVTLIGGEPGIGKSTLLLQIVNAMCNMNCLYVTAEESVDQVKIRAVRLNINVNNSNVSVTSVGNIDQLLISPDLQQFQFIVIDSIQTVYTDTVPSAPGTVSQIKACSQQLINFAKHYGIIMVIVGHVTKDGQIAGPKLLEHMVDTVLYFEGDHYNHYRILRAVKNRFGNINEIGVFEMVTTGLREIRNPSELFLLDRENNVSGTAIFVGIEGSRPILVEIQALVAPSTMPMPKRSSVGWDINRLSMILAILSVRFGLNLSNKEVYLSVAGGLKITEPAVDLAVAAALISAAYNKPLPKSSVFFGEIGLSGEVRKSSQIDARRNEAEKQGYANVYSANEIAHIKQLKSLW